MTPAKQRHKHWCALACLESASIDLGDKRWTQELIDHTFTPYYAEPDLVFQPIMFPMVSLTIRLGNCVHLGTSKDFLLKYSNRLDKVTIFIATQRDKGGGRWGHCWRV